MSTYLFSVFLCNWVWCRICVNADVVCILFAHFYCICMRALVADEPKVFPVGLLVRKTVRKD